MRMDARMNRVFTNILQNFCQKEIPNCVDLMHNREKKLTKIEKKTYSEIIILQI